MDIQKLADRAMSLTALWSKLGELRGRIVNELLPKSEIEILQDEIKELKHLIATTEREVGINREKLVKYLESDGYSFSEIPIEISMKPIHELPSEALLSLYQKECEVLDHQVDFTGLE